MTATSSSSNYGSYAFMLRASNRQVAEAIGLSVRRVQEVRKTWIDEYKEEEGAQGFAAQMSNRYSELRRTGKLPEPTPVVTHYYPKKEAVHA